MINSRFLDSRLTIFVNAIAFCIAVSTAMRGAEVACPAADECRDTAPRGKLLHADGIWTSPCSPNAVHGGHDLICEDIVSCPAAGGFGKFLQAVTGNCRSKTFDGYHGLDGLTFGILDWTSNNLPALFEIYKQRSPEKFDAIFGPLHLPFNGMCLDPKWVCDNNRSGALNCDSNFRSAFERSVRDPDLQKGQLEFALHQFAGRITRFQRLGLKTQYGLVSMAVVANNLRPSSGCKPENWMQECKSRGSEAQIVDCMLDKYVQGACRGGHSDATKRRRDVIEQVFQNHKDDLYNNPEVSAIESCSSKWGQSSGVHP
jgi:hypothetical protein